MGKSCSYEAYFKGWSHVMGKQQGTRKIAFMLFKGPVERHHAVRFLEQHVSPGQNSARMVYGSTRPSSTGGRSITSGTSTNGSSWGRRRRSRECSEFSAHSSGECIITQPRKSYPIT
jgi:hypothetical protein